MPEIGPVVPEVTMLLFKAPKYVIPVTTGFMPIPMNLHLDKHGVTIAFLPQVPTQGEPMNAVPNGYPSVLTNQIFMYGEGLINIETY